MKGISGPILVLAIGVLIYLAVRHQEHVKRALAGVGASAEGLKSIFGGLSGSKSKVAILFLGAILVTLFVFGALPTPEKWVPPWHTPRFADVGTWSWDHWLPLVVLWGIIAAFIALNAGKAAETLQWLLATVMFTLFVVSPAWNWLSEPGSSPQKQAAAMPHKPLAQALPHDAPDLPRAWNADGSMTDASTWPRVQVPAKGNSVHVPNIFGGHLVWGGSGFKVHCVYTDGHEGIVGDAIRPCSDGNIVEMYARNEGETLIYASYAYAKQNEK